MMLITSIVSRGKQWLGPALVALVFCASVWISAPAIAASDAAEAMDAIQNRAEQDLDRVAGSGTTNQIKGKAQEDLGRVQREVDKATSQVEGAAKQLQGKAQKDIGRTQAAAEDAADAVEDTAKQLQGKVQKDIGRTQAAAEDATEAMEDSTEGFVDSIKSFFGQ